MTTQQPSSDTDTASQISETIDKNLQKTSELLAANNEIFEQMTSQDPTEKVNADVDALMETVNEDLDKAMQQLSEQLEKIRETMQL